MFNIIKPITDNSVNYLPNTFMEELYPKYYLSTRRNTSVEYAINSIENILRNTNIDQGDLNTISFPKIEIIQSILKTLNPDDNLEYIKNKIEFPEEVQTYILNNKLMLEVLVKIVSKTIEILSKEYNELNKIVMFLGYDIEIPDWEQLTIFIYLKENNFDKILNIWEKVGDELQKIFTQLKMEKFDEILLDEINKKIFIEIKEWENV